jgi:hypothetical protein
MPILPKMMHKQGLWRILYNESERKNSKATVGSIFYWPTVILNARRYLELNALDAYVNLCRSDLASNKSTMKHKKYCAVVLALWTCNPDQFDAAGFGWLSKKQCRKALRAARRVILKYLLDELKGKILCALK